MQRKHFLFACFILLAAPAWADRGRGGGDAPQGGQSRGITPAQAGEMARRQTGGRVLAVTAGDGGYRVKVLTPQGEVRYVFVPGR